MVNATRFEALSGVHLALGVVFAVGAWYVVRVGRSHRGTKTARGFSRAFAVAIPIFTLPLQAWQFTPADWDLGTSLPLQLCDLAWVAATYALWTHRRWAAAVTYYWGLTLTTQAMITPALAEAFPHPRFVAYWGMHLLVVWAAIYLAWGLGIGPTWRNYRTTVLITAIWAVCIYAFNVTLDVNYGYLNRKPASASILDLLGPWPIYVVLEILIIVTGWALMTWPWVAAERRRGAAEPSRPHTG